KSAAVWFQRLTSTRNTGLEEISYWGNPPYRDARPAANPENCRSQTGRSLSKPPANGRWNGLFAWDECCGGKHAGKIDADGGCRGTGRLAQPIEIGAAR